MTMRVFNVQLVLEDFCTLKPGQTPEVDELKPVIDWATADDFGMEGKFVTEVTANLRIDSAGRHDFRITSDDGSRLIIDGTQVIDNGGKHGARPKDGSVHLSTGHHALRIDH